MRALSRKIAYRKSTLRNLATSLILYERMTTTTAKAKETKSMVEKLINSARKRDLIARRRLMAFLFDKNAVKKVLEDLLPRYKNIPTGFIRSYKIGPRLGDGAEMSILQLVEGEKPKVKEKDAEKEKPTQKAAK